MQASQGFTCGCFLRVVLYPDFGLSLHERNLAQRAGGIGIENMSDDTQAGQRVDGQLSVKQGGRNVNPLHYREGGSGFATNTHDEVDAFGHHVVG